MADKFVKYIADRDHYTEVLERIAKVRRQLWIGTADIKDLYMKKGSGSTPFLGVLDGLLNKGVEVRLIHAKEPGAAFREDFDKYPRLASSLERILCPRVHFKLMIFDLETAYVGSANLTGAGIGMKSEQRRNFEAGILTNEPELVEAAVNQFDGVWMGAHCKKCGRKYFKDPDDPGLHPLLMEGLCQYFSKYEDDNVTPDNLGYYLLVDPSTLQLPEEAPCLTAEGLAIAYSEYEIAPYAAGAPSFVIPYEKVKPYLTDEVRELIRP